MRLLFVALAVCACGPAEPAVAGGAGVVAGTRPPVSSGTEAERWFPLVHGHLYQYAVAQAGGTARLLVRVERSDAQHGMWRIGNEARYFRYAPDGVVRLSDLGAPRGYVLKLPLAVGSGWVGEHGGNVRIQAADAVIEVAAGKFSGCVQTIEERGGDQPALFSTTFCPDVGVVLLEAGSADSAERAELVSFGPPVDIGGDGVRRLEDESD